MQHNPEIERIVEHSIKIAKQLNHRYVTVEHLALALIQFQPFRKICIKHGVDIPNLEKELGTKKSLHPNPKKQIHWKDYSTEQAHRYYFLGVDL